VASVKEGGVSILQSEDTRTLTSKDSKEDVGDNDIAVIPTYVVIATLMIRMLRPSEQAQSILLKKLADIPTLLREAEQMIGIVPKYDKSFYDSLNLNPLTRKHCEEGDQALLSGKTLDEIFEKQLITLRNPGATPEDVRRHFDCASNIETAIDLLSNGLITPMHEGFKRNEGRECSHGTSYLSRLPLCNHSLVEFIKLGRGIVLSWDALMKTGQLKNCHISAIVHALSKKAEGRTYLHNSKRSRSFPSVNESVDLDEAHRLYPSISYSEWQSYRNSPVNNNKNIRKRFYVDVKLMS
jgi:hypothetical protein